MRTNPPTPQTHRPGGMRCASRLLLCAGLLAAAAIPTPARAASDLTALSLEQLLDMTVVGASKYEQRQSEVGASVRIITRDEIRTFGWRTLNDALASLPGMHGTYDRQYQYIGMRGFGLPGDYNSRVLVMVDGNRLNDSVCDSGISDLGFPLDMELVQRIEFIPGPGGAVYGQNAMLGVVNVVTRSGADIGGTELAASAQSLNRLHTGRATWGGTLDTGVDLVLSASGLRASGQDLFLDYGAAGVSGLARGLDGESARQVFAKASHGPWSLQFLSGTRRKDDPTGVLLSDPLVPGAYQSDRFTLAQGQYQADFWDKKLQVQARLFAGQQQYKSMLNYGTRFSFPAAGDWRGAELRTLYLGLAGHKLMRGLEWQDNFRVSQRSFGLDGSGKDISISSPGTRTGIYVQDEWRIAETLTATLGMRFDHNSTTGNRTSPRAALIWQAAPTTTFKALYGRAHRAPNAFERDYSDGFSQVGNPDLKGEGIDTLELVADHRVGSDLQLHVSLYQWEMQDLIALGMDLASGNTRYQAGGDVKARGAEIAADTTWTWGGRLRGSIALQRVRNDAGAKLLNSPQLLGKLNFSTPLPVAGLRLGYELRYDSARLTVNGSETGGAAVSNLRLSTDKLAKGLEVGLAVRNLLDKRYAHPGASTNWQNTLRQDGRSVAIDARLRF